MLLMAFGHILALLLVVNTLGSNQSVMSDFILRWVQPNVIKLSLLVVEIFYSI